MKSTDAILSACAMQYQRAQVDLDLVMHVGMVIDEVAVYFDRTTELDAFVEEASERGWVADRGASVPLDAMFEDGIVMGFNVRFEFLHKENVPWRIEAMHVLDGWAPLHRRSNAGDIIHVSGKVEAGNRGQYENLKLVLARAGLPFQKEYGNNYGVFSYFGHQAPYFKPRVNMRDV